MKNFKKVLIVIISLFIVFCIYAFSSYEGEIVQEIKETDIKETDIKETNNIKDKKIEIQYISVNAKDMLIDYENEVKGNKLYKDKYIKLTGIINRISESGGEYYVYISNGEDFSLRDIKCTMKKSEEDNIIELNEEDQVIIMGKCNGKGWIDIEIEDCIIFK